MVKLKFFGTRVTTKFCMHEKVKARVNSKKRLLRIVKLRLEDNIKVDIKEIRFGYLEIHSSGSGLCLVPVSCEQDDENSDFI
jgi:hypothetical protein